MRAPSVVPGAPRVFGLVIALALTLPACSGDDLSGPVAPTVDGQWSYSASNISGSGVACDVSNMTMQLAQSGTTFSGVSAGGILTCRAGGQSESGAFGGDIVANGRIDGNSVSWDLGTSDVHHTGTISGNSMSGQVTIRLDVGGGDVVLAGNWSAVRT